MNKASLKVFIYIFKEFCSLRWSLASLVARFAGRWDFLGFLEFLGFPGISWIFVDFLDVLDFLGFPRISKHFLAFIGTSRISVTWQAGLYGVVAAVFINMSWISSI